MEKLFIVRHGQDTDNANGILNGRRDNPLTELGREQAKIVAEKLSDEYIKVIYSSPLKRAFQSAEIISGRIGVEPIQTHELLLEREFGVMTGKFVSDIPKLTPKILATEGVNYFLEADGAETFPEVYKRAWAFLLDVERKQQNGNVLVVAHGDIGKMIRASYHGWTWEEGLKTPHFDNTHILELSGEKERIE